MAISMLCPFSTFAQGVPILIPGNLDVTAFGTSAFGSSLGSVTVSSSGIPSEKGTFTVGAPSSNGGGGVRATWAITRRIRLYAEWSYIAGSRNNVNTNWILAGPPESTRQITLNVDTSFNDVIGGLEWLFPIVRNPKLIPYLQVGAGTIIPGGSVSGSNIGATPGGTFSAAIQGARVVWSGGSGIRYYFTERAGLCVEVDGLFGPGSAAGTISGSPAVITHGSTHSGRFVYGFVYTFH